MRTSTRVGIRHGRRGRPSLDELAAYRLRLLAMPWEVLEALGLCECGRPLTGHPPLPRARDWSEGRPCSRDPRVTIWTLGR